MFLKGIVRDNKVLIMDVQASSMLSSFAMADGLVYLPAGTSHLAAGDTVEIHLIR